VSRRKRVPRFWLQATTSFPDGAPDRAEYMTDEAFFRACLVYDVEWRAAYICGEAKCENHDCPQHHPETYETLRASHSPPRPIRSTP
jgi:hypothetical protein